jgi:AcrR family transcriptional regulator
MDGKTVDLRVRRTRKLLQEAFLKLMSKKSFQAITVQDISAEAMVNRSTFYDHFVDQYELAELLIQILNGMPQKHGLLRGFIGSAPNLTCGKSRNDVDTDPK